MATIPKIRTLESIAVKIRDLAIAKAPRKTGNLRNKIKSANTPAKTKMIKQLKDFSIQLSLDYAPLGAEYGEWFNDFIKPVSKRRKSLIKTAKRRGNWNYAIDAMNDAELNAAFQAYLDDIGDYVIEELSLELDKQ